MVLTNGKKSDNFIDLHILEQSGKNGF